MENSVFTQLFGYSNLPPSDTLVTPEGLTKITIDPDDDDMDNTTLDLAVAATSLRTGDVALNYDLVRIAAGDIATGNCTLTLGDGQRVGQIWALELVGAITTSIIVITITNVIGGQTVFNLDSKYEALIVRWNGYAWEVLIGRTANICGVIAVIENDLVIPITHRVVSKTGGADAEACTLANGTFDGQLLTIHIVAGAGANTVTPVTCTGFTAVVLTAAEDTVTLEWVDSTIGWIVLGVTADTAANYPVIT
jgi:hypothetical protein